MSKMFIVLLAFAIPIFAAVYVIAVDWKIGDDLPVIVISAFSIFSAMLFASQVAAFSVFHFKMLELSPQKSEDDIIYQTDLENSSRRITELRDAFKAVNSGISVLTITSVAITVLTLLLEIFVEGEVVRICTAAIVLLATHFFASFFYTCLQVFTVFDSAYSGERL